MVVKKKIQCPFCEEVFEGHPNQIYFWISMHLEKFHPLEKEKVMEQIIKELGISESELKSVEYLEKQYLGCPSCGYKWKGKNPFKRKKNYVSCPKCKEKLSVNYFKKQLRQK